MTNFLAQLKKEALENAKSQTTETYKIDLTNPSDEDVQRLLNKNVNFGKYKGRTFRHVLMHDYEYFKWMHKHMKPEWAMFKVFKKLV